MVLLALDTATAATVVGVQAGDGPVVTRRHDPGPGGRPGHAAELLALAREALAEAGATLADVTRIGCGTGPGTFTGLRIGVATARALAAAGGAELVPVPTLQALAHAALDGERPVLAVLDARRGEAYVQPFDATGAPLAPAAAVRPEALVVPEGAVAVGDGARRFADRLGGAPAADDALHRVGGAALVALARAGTPVPAASLVPEYVRDPDAVKKADR